MGKISNIISQEEASLDLLYLCHTTSFESFLKIINNGGKLELGFSFFPPIEDKNEREEKRKQKDKDGSIIYFFYGLPLFIYDNSKGNVDPNYTADLPVGILFKDEVLKHMPHFYPFDTGAAFKGWYNCFRKDVRELNELNEFQIALNDNGEQLKKFVSRYFTDNESYCYFKPNGRHSENMDEEEILHLHRTHGDNIILDSRSTMLEVHATADIEISSKTVKAILVPKTRCRQYSNTYEDIVKQCPGIEIIEYRDYGRCSPRDYRMLLIDKTMDEYNKQGFFSYGRK